MLICFWLSRSLILLFIFTNNKLTLELRYITIIHETIPYMKIHCVIPKSFYNIQLSCFWNNLLFLILLYSIFSKWTHQCKISSFMSKRSVSKKEGIKNIWYNGDNNTIWNGVGGKISNENSLPKSFVWASKFVLCKCKYLGISTV